MEYVTLIPTADDDVDETFLDQLSGNGAFVHAAVQVMQLHSGHVADMRWPVDLMVDETVVAAAVAGPAYPWYPKIFANIRVDGLPEGWHTLSLVNTSAPRTYRVRWYKTSEMEFLTVWFIHYANNFFAVTLNVLGHSSEQSGWV